jgi:hypothetical protein
MENGCICTNGGVPVRALGAAASLLCTALVAATDPACGPPNTNDCFAANATPGCADATCCRTICGCDPFCCSVTWDGYCAGSGYVPGCGAALLCSLPPAACCINGACSELNSGDCAAAGGVYQGAGTLCATTVCGLPPSNDDCNDAALIECGDSVVVDNSFATTQLEEELAPLSCYFGGPNTMTGSVWYRVEGTGDTVEISTCNSTGTDDTLIVVYGDGSNITDCSVVGIEIACSEDAGCGPTGLLSRVCIDTEVGVAYLVGVGSFDDASRGEITIDVTCPCPVGACCFSADGSCIDIAQSLCQAQGGIYQGDGTACATTSCPIFPDECAFPQAIDCGESVTFDQTAGTTNATDPAFSCHFGGAAQGVNSAWFEFTPTTTGVVLSTCASPSTLDTLIGVYEGDCGSLVEIACGEDSGCGVTGFLTELTVCGLTPGNTYLVQVGAFSLADAGMTTLSLECIDTCPDCDTGGVCPKGGTPEGEANCGLPTDTVNGGCNSTPNVLTSVECGDVICGSGAFDGSLRDTDWYELTVAAESEVTLTVETGGQSYVWGLISDANGAPSNSCATAAQIAPLALGSCASVTVCLPPGTYWWFVGPDFSAVHACGDPTGNYVAEWTCTPSECPSGACCFSDGSCTDGLTGAECGTNGGVYQGDGTSCATVVCPEICGPTNPNDCFVSSPTGTPGCNDADCCNTVCAVDPFCCDIAWDGICAGEAATMCGVTAPENDDCADRIDISDGVTAFTTVGATTDGVGDPLCLSFSSDQIFNDIWYNYEATCDGTLTIHTCGASYDSRIAVYEGTTCPTGSAIACNDDAAAGPCSGTLQSYLEVAVECGQVYKIRVGAFSTTGFGSGNITISCAGTPCPTEPCPDCVTSATFAPPPDGNVDAADLAFLLGAWGACPGCCPDTVTSATFAPPPDGVVDAADLAFLLGAWGTPTAACN